MNVLKRELCNNKETLILLERRKEKIKHKIKNCNQTVALRVVGGANSVAGQNYERILTDAANKTRTLLAEQSVNPVLATVETHRIVCELSDQSGSIVPREFRYSQP